MPSALSDDCESDWERSRDAPTSILPPATPAYPAAPDLAPAVVAFADGSCDAGRDAGRDPILPKRPRGPRREDGLLPRNWLRRLCSGSATSARYALCSAAATTSVGDCSSATSCGAGASDAGKNGRFRSCSMNEDTEGGGSAVRMSSSAAIVCAMTDTSRSFASSPCQTTAVSTLPEAVC